MATGSATWRATIDTSWIEDGNYLENQHPIGGDTFTADGGEVGYPALPDANLPGAGVISFTFTANYNVVVTDFLSGATIGLVTVDDAAARINLDANFAGATISDGTLIVTGGLASSQAISVTGVLNVWTTLTMAGGMDVELQTGGTLVGLGGAPVLDGDILAAGNAMVDWGSALEIIGSFDAAGHVITHNNILDGVTKLTCDIGPKNLDLGANLPILDVEIQAATTATRALTVYSWEMTAGTYDDGGLDHTITTDILVTGGVLTSTGEWTMVDDGDIAGGVFDTLVLAQPTFTSSLTANTVCKKLTLGTGTLDGAFRMDVQIGANDSIVQDATTINLTELRAELQGALFTNAALDTSGGSTIFSVRGNARTLRMTGDLNCGTNELYLNAVSAVNAVTLDLVTGNVALLVGDVVLGFKAAQNRGGILNTGTVVTITGNVIGGDATNKASNELNFPAGATINLTGSIDGTLIDTITAGAGVTITGGGTLSHMDTDPGNIVICLNMINGGDMHASYVFVGDATWDASTDGNWTTEITNWTPEVIPSDGHTATFAGTEAGYPTGLPNANLPGAGVISFTITGAYFPLNTIASLLGGASIGLVTVNNVGAVVYTGGDFAGAVITAGTLKPNNNTSSQDIVVTGTLNIYNTLEMDAGMDVILQAGGTLTGQVGGVLDGDLLAAGNAVVNWGDGGLDIIGSFDAQGFDITHSNLIGGNTLVCDIAGNLDLGSTSGLELNALAIEIQAATTATLALVCKDWEMTAGAYDDGGLDHTVANDILVSGGVLTSAGEWTQAGIGDIAGGTFAALVITASARTTLTAPVTCNKLTLGSGDLLGAGQSMTVNFVADNAFVQHDYNTIEIDTLLLIPGAAVRLCAAVDTSGGTTVLQVRAADRTLRMTGDMDTGTNPLVVIGAAPGELARLDLATNNRDMAAGAVTLGAAGGTTHAGRLDLGPTSTITGLIEGGNPANAGANVLTLATGGTHNWSGSIDGTNIDTITAGAGVTITGGGTMSECPNSPGNRVDCAGMIDGGNMHILYDFIGDAAELLLLGVG